MRRQSQSCVYRSEVRNKMVLHAHTIIKLAVDVLVEEEREVLCFTHLNVLDSLGLSPRSDQITPHIDLFLTCFGHCL